MREFLVKYKSNIIRVLILLLVCFLVVAYINGRNIYKQKVKMMQEQHSNISVGL